MSTTLDKVQQLIDQLTPLEQARLMEYLTPRIVQAVETAQAEHPTHKLSSEEAWQMFFRLGEAVAEADRPEAPTLTQSVISARR